MFDASFVAGAAIGVGATVFVWWVPAKWLVPHIEFGRLEVPSEGGTPDYTVTVQNAGRRDIIDVTVSCTLFSRGWGDGNDEIIATISFPTTVGHIDVMPGTGRGRNSSPELATLGPRVITLQLSGISETQLKKLDGKHDATRAKIESGTITLEELFELGANSFINVAVYGVDRYSGTRGLYNGLVIKRTPNGGWESTAQRKIHHEPAAPA